MLVLVRYASGVAMLLLTSLGSAQQLPLTPDAEAQPLCVVAQRLAEALDYLGQPLSEKERQQLEAAIALPDDGALIQGVQELLDPRCLLGVTINPESRVKVEIGPAERVLVKNGWRCFLVKVVNQAGTTAALSVQSPNALPRAGSPAGDLRDRWLEANMFQDRPMTPTLQGIPLEYRIIQLSTAEVGKRTAVLAMDVGQGTQDLGFRSDATLTFECKPSTPVTFRVRDEKDQPATASFVVRDSQGRVYPSQSKRLAPDFAFHPQVYRADGESIDLPAGSYTIDCSRGPEYLKQTRSIEVGDAPLEVAFELERWVDPASRGWWSGDHHIHAAGCMHYDDPTQGVHAPDMYRHMLGEDLKVGANLTWGPCFDYQKQFFTGLVDEISQYPYLLRYDIEVSGFGSHQSGHLCLLRLKDQMYPGGDSMDHWPTLGLNTLRWAKKQGAVCGPAHSGLGLRISTDDIPSYEMPRFDSIGANEYIVDVTHLIEGPEGELVPAVDFMATANTPVAWELNIWYHTLNCGYRTRISGETDFPCIFGDRVGLGRSYVKLDGRLNYDDWCEGIRLGRSYVSDRRSHLMDFQVQGIEVGTNDSEVRLASPGAVRLQALVAARLEPETDGGAIRTIDFDGDKLAWPGWHLERARVKGTRRVPVEVVVNGEQVARTEIVADGVSRPIELEIEIDKSSWVALRILYSSHTNPVFVLVDDQPIRANKRSAEWCLRAVEQCWSQKERHYDQDEMQDAIDAYEHARREYRRIIGECE